jgi:hypothetical protein
VVHEPWTESTPFPLENKSEIQKSHHFAKRPLFLSNINPRSTNFQEAPRIFKNNYKYSPSHFPEIINRSPKFFSSYPATATPISTILAPKFLQSFTLSFHAFIIHVCCILINYVYTSRLGNVVPEPFFEDFQDQAFEEFQLFFMDQQGKLP